MRKLKDLALHLPLGGLDRTPSSPASSPRHPRSPSSASSGSQIPQTASDELHNTGATSSPSGSTISSSTIQDKKRNLSPLHQACKQGDLPLIHCLLLPAISPSSDDIVGEPATGDYAGWLPVHLLLSSRALSPLAAHPPELPLLPLLSALLHSPSKGSLVNVKNGQGMTPLHLAISRGCAPNVIRHLLALGADPTLTVKGKTCIQLAQNEETVKILLESRAPSASGPVLTKASSRLDIRRSMDLLPLPTEPSSPPTLSLAPPSNHGSPSSSSSLSSLSKSGNRVVSSPRDTTWQDSVDTEDSSSTPSSLSSSPTYSSPLASPRDPSGRGGGGSGIGTRGSTIKKRKSATLTKHKSRPASPSVDDAENVRAAALALEEQQQQQQQRWLAEQRREWARVAQRVEEERTIYLMLCLLSALLAVIGGHLCGYYMGQLDADQHYRDLRLAVSLANSSSPSSSFSFFSSFFSSSVAAPPPVVLVEDGGGDESARMLTLMRASSSLGGGLLAFAGLVSLYHFALKMLR